MKILLISNMYPNEEYPSYGVFVKNFEESFLEEGAVIKRIVLFKKKNILIKLLYYILFYIRIIYNISFSKYDCVYAHYISHTSIPLLILKKFKHYKLIINVHGSDIVYKNKLGKILDNFTKKIVEKSNLIVVPSAYFKNLVKDKYNIDDDKIIISPSGGIDKKKFYPIDNNKEMRVKYGLNDDIIIIGYIGRLDPGKEWSIFLESLRLLIDEFGENNIKGIVVGSGSEKNKFEKSILNLHLEKNILYLESMNQKDLNNIYNIIDLLCFPTKGESLGLVALEAMATGTPVVGSNNTALPEYILNGKTGFLSDNLSREFYKNMKKLIHELTKDNYYRDNCIEKSYEYNKNKVKKILYSKVNNICK